MLPNPNFIAELTDIPKSGYLSVLHNTNLFEAFCFSNEALVLNRTPLVNAQYGNLFAYMHRRFGMPNIAGDPDKDLTSGWLLTSQEKNIYLLVKPSLSSSFYSFTPMILCDDQHTAPRALSESMLPTYNKAIETTLLDLLRPVGVRDKSINALGLINDNDKLMDFDHKGESLYLVEHAGTIASHDPLRLFGGRDNAKLNFAMELLGKGQAFVGRDLIYTMAKEALIKKLSEEGPTFIALVLTALHRYSPAQCVQIRDALRLHSDPNTWSHITEIESQLSTSFNLKEKGYNFGTLNKSIMKQVELFLNAFDVDHNLTFDIETSHYNLRLMHHANKLIPLVNDGPTPEDEIAPAMFDWTNQTSVERVESAWLEGIIRAKRDDLLDWYRNLIDTEKNGKTIFFDIMMRWCKNREEEKHHSAQ